MAKYTRVNIPRVNFFDGQRITERDLDDEQIKNQSLVSNITSDFHGSGVVKDYLFQQKILLDTRSPGFYAKDSRGDSYRDINNGKFDGKPIYVDVQPSDTDMGCRLEVSCHGLDIGGSTPTKVMLIGVRHNSLSASGELFFEILNFQENSIKITKSYFKRVVCVIFNNLSGGIGRSHNSSSVVHKDRITLHKGGVVIKEAGPLKTFPRGVVSSQDQSPNIDLANFASSSAARSLKEDIVKGLGSSYSFSDLYYELESSSKLYFKKDADPTISYGQKFLCETNNIQRVDLLLSVEKDELASAGSEFDFSGDIVVSIHELATEVFSSNGVVPTTAIGFDPLPSPVAEASFGMEDLKLLGYELDEIPRVVSFDFSNSLIADPNIEPSVSKDKFYAVMVSRRGNNRVGTLVMEKGYERSFRKKSNGQQLNVEESFSNEKSRYVEYDPLYRKYLDDSDASLWFRVHSATVEVTYGTAYTEDGYEVTIPKFRDYVGDTKIPFYVDKIPLSTVVEGDHNYILLQRASNFTAPSVHPRTGNFVYTRIEDVANVYSVTKTELDKYDEKDVPIILSRVIDKNVRSASQITGKFDKPGFIYSDEIIIYKPSNEILSENLINRVITPDLDCECASRYRIVASERSEVLAGDINKDGKITSADIISLLNVVGNTINSETTERKILGGELDVVSFLQADLNEDDTVDGFDIELIEDAVDGYVNFTVSETLDILKLKLENILQSSNNPTIFSDSLKSGSAIAGSSNITFSTTSDEQALAIRLNDVITIESGFSDSGVYYVSSKSVAEDGKLVTVSVVDSSGNEPFFVGSTLFNASVTSGTDVNCFADNIKIMNVPFKELSWSIDHVGSAHDDMFVDVCDLRRFVDVAVLELDSDECLYDKDSEKECSPKYKNQIVVANDIYIPDGEIYSRPGVPYHGDFEFSKISIPLPPGTITDCEINIYENFVKAYNSTTKTKSGYNAMKYSDGTYVGCEDTTVSTDLTKKRVKFSQAIASLHVDGFIDGYGVDGYADAKDSEQTYEAIQESFSGYEYTGFDLWSKDSNNSSTSVASVSNPSGPNDPAIFQINSVTADERFARINQPSSIGTIKNDFIYDFKASRSFWPESSLTRGKISFFSTLNVSNSDGSTSKVKLGWRQVGGKLPEIFFSGEIFAKTGELVSDFDFSHDMPGSIGDEVLFRVRRVGEVFSAMYFNPYIIDATSNQTGQYIKIGKNPKVHPGAGTVSTSFEISQNNEPNPGLSFSGKLHEVHIMSDYSTSLATEGATIGRDSATNTINRLTLTFPIKLTQKTNLISATLQMPTNLEVSTKEYFNVFPIDADNSKNLGRFYNYPIKQNASFVKTFTPGTVSAGRNVEIDLTSMFIMFLSETSHLPGYYKGIIIEPLYDGSYTMDVSSNMTLLLTYEDVTTGVIFKIGARVNPDTGMLTLNTKNILYDSSNVENRTVLDVGVFLKKSGFVNNDLEVAIKDLTRIGLGTCVDEVGFVEDELCFFIAGSTATGTFVQGPFPCQFKLPRTAASNSATASTSSSSSGSSSSGSTSSGSTSSGSESSSSY